MSPWDPQRYLSFGGFRLRPALDLLARIPVEAPRTVVDLGCGPGNVTALLAERWPAARVEGLDSSEAMLAEARARQPSIAWTRGDIAAWQPAEPVDVLFTNAALQWLPDHASLFPRLLSAVAPEGVFACQMPRNFNAPSHVLLRETAAEAPWAAKLQDALRSRPVLDPAEYFDLVASRVSTVDLWETEYIHLLKGEDPVLHWTRATALLPVLETLQGAELDAFLARYAEKLRAAYPRRPDGRTLFPFRRLFLVARR
jgi:trans-aconitate 2-methyltransferase